MSGIVTFTRDAAVEAWHLYFAPLRDGVAIMRRLFSRAGVSRSEKHSAANADTGSDEMAALVILRDIQAREAQTRERLESLFAQVSETNARIAALHEALRTQADQARRPASPTTHEGSIAAAPQGDAVLASLRSRDARVLVLARRGRQALVWRRAPQERFWRRLFLDLPIAEPMEVPEHFTIVQFEHQAPLSPMTPEALDALRVLQLLTREQLAKLIETLDNR